jgi:Fe-S cluster biogenesis protein NfuA
MPDDEAQPSTDELSAASSSPESRDERDARIAEHVAMLSDFLGQHAGGLTLEGIDDDGHVTVRYTGMCTGCLYRPVTMGATIRPYLLEVDGVTSVEAVGSRMNDQANARLQEDLGRWWLDLEVARPEPTGGEDA